MAHYAIFTTEHPSEREIFQRPEQAVLRCNELIDYGHCPKCEVWYMGEYKPMDLRDLYELVMGDMSTWD